MGPVVNSAGRDLLLEDVGERAHVVRQHEPAVAAPGMISACRICQVESPALREGELLTIIVEWLRNPSQRIHDENEREREGGYERSASCLVASPRPREERETIRPPVRHHL